MSPTSYQTAPSRDNKKEDKRFELLRGLTHLTVFKTVPFSQTWVILHNKSYLQFLTSNHNEPCRTRTYDRTVMSRLLQPTGLKVQVLYAPRGGGTRTLAAPGMNRTL